MDDNVRYDPHYRILAVVYVNETNLNEKLVKEGYAGVMYIPPSEFDSREWEYFTVDRRRTLEQGQMINLVRYSDVRPHELQVHVDFLFPDGVTSHGDYYILRGKTPAMGVSPIIELLFEYIRRSHFPFRPSRFQSVFAFENIDQE